MDKRFRISYHETNDNYFVDYALWKYNKGRFSCSFTHDEFWKIKQGSAIIKDSNGNIEEAKGGD